MQKKMALIEGHRIIPSNFDSVRDENAEDQVHRQEQIEVSCFPFGNSFKHKEIRDPHGWTAFKVQVSGEKWQQN